MNILLVCTFGMSTSLLVKKMKDEAKARGIETHIDAMPVEELPEMIDYYDAILFGPQVKYKEKMVSELCAAHSKKYIFIPPQVYGMVDGKKTLELALKLMEK